MADQLSVQVHPMGRVELSPDQSHVARHRRRGFSHGRIDELFHRNSMVDSRYLARSKATMSELPADLPAVDPDYPSVESLALPEPAPLNRRLDDILNERRSRRSFTGRGVSRKELATILGHAVGVTDTRSSGSAVETFRPYPSAGGLFPVEVYPIILDGRNVASGLYYYTPRSHALRVLDDTPNTERFENAFMNAEFSREVVNGAAVIFVLTASFPRIRTKYGPMGYRFALFEAGHLAQNLLLAVEAAGMGGTPVASFFGESLDEFLNIDGVNESAVYPVAVGHPEDDE